MDHNANPLILGATAIVAGFIGLACVFSPREYRDLMLRFQGSQRWQPDWLTRFQQSEANVWAIRLSGAIGIAIAIVFGYAAYRTTK